MIFFKIWSIFAIEFKGNYEGMFLQRFYAFRQMLTLLTWFIKMFTLSFLRELLASTNTKQSVSYRVDCMHNVVCSRYYCVWFVVDLPHFTTDIPFMMEYCRITFYVCRNMKIMCLLLLKQEYTKNMQILWWTCVSFSSGNVY